MIQNEQVMYEEDLVPDKKSWRTPPHIGGHHHCITLESLDLFSEKQLAGF